VPQVPLTQPAEGTLLQPGLLQGGGGGRGGGGGGGGDLWGEICVGVLGVGGGVGVTYPELTNEAPYCSQNCFKVVVVVVS
jgi:hypothetical protein